METQLTIHQVQEYYGRTLTNSGDLKTGACCTADSLPGYVREVLSLIDDEIKDKFYGCGSPIPDDIDGRTILDLGCGSGRDVYVLSKLVGENGRVIGVDMTEEQLRVARRHQETQAQRFSFPKPNTEFRLGCIENLAEIGIEDASIDVVISNCVINLSPDKRSVFKEIFRVLKPGGELYFSDVFAGQRIPASLRDDPVLLGECLSGALYVEDFRRMLADLGCPDYRLVKSSSVPLLDPAIEAKIGMIRFQSLTLRAFRLDELEDIGEDYGQVAIYKGTMPRCQHAFNLDDHHCFQTNKPMLVCGNTAAMLKSTRYARHFTVLGDRSVHYGPFDYALSGNGLIAAESESGCC